MDVFKVVLGTVVGCFGGNELVEVNNKVRILVTRLVHVVVVSCTPIKFVEGVVSNAVDLALDGATMREELVNESMLLSLIVAVDPVLSLTEFVLAMEPTDDARVTVTVLSPVRNDERIIVGGAEGVDAVDPVVLLSAAISLIIEVNEVRDTEEPASIVKSGELVLNPVDCLPSFVLSGCLFVTLSSGS